MKLEIEYPQIFSKYPIISGVTKINKQLFPKTGLSFSEAQTLSFEEVISHKKLLSEFLNIDYYRLKFQHQVHGKTIQIVDENTSYSDSDGMITNINNLVLCSKIADCCAILIYDTKNKTIAALHSGWKGTKQNISKVGINALSDVYGSKTEDLLVYLSASAGKEKYEVKYDVAKFFPNSITQIADDKFLFDNRKEIFNQLLELGVKESSIEISPVCTISNPDYHSYRRDKEKSGRMAAYIMME